MDLMASTTFVLEPAERTIYTRPPRDSRHDLFDLNMMKGIAVSGLSLFIAVMVPYFYALHIGVPQQTAQTLAFSAWMVGQVTLAFVMRSNYEPLSQLGPLLEPGAQLHADLCRRFLLIALGVPAVGSYHQADAGRAAPVRGCRRLRLRHDLLAGDRQGVALPEDGLTGTSPGGRPLARD